MALGFVTAWYMYIKSPETPKRLAETHRGLYQFLLNKWYFDELYDFSSFVPQRRSAASCGRRATSPSSTTMDRTALQRVWLT